ncbi:MAG TPA: hypothetical protein VMH81_02450 [Bryobacteraceae bacterium]|nr:hypothetical protein [Bryobacteraceae bacterium]
MRTILKCGAFLCFAAALSFGAPVVYRGQLMDAGCYNQNQSQSGEKSWVRCAPQGSTTSFAVHTNGRVRMLDQAGNDKAEAAFQHGDLKRDRNGDMPVVIYGSRHGNTIMVESIRARGSDTSIH